MMTQEGTVLLAGWWRRFGGYVLDLIIVGVATAIVLKIIEKIDDLEIDGRRDSDDDEIKHVAAEARHHPARRTVPSCVITVSFLTDCEGGSPVWASTHFHPTTAASTAPKDPGTTPEGE